MIKVLIADDQELIRQSLSIILGLKEEISVVGGVGDGTEVLEFIAKEKPDIILMDIRMPTMDGVECTKIVKEKYPEIKIIVLTTFDDDKYVFSALKYGASGYLLKGISVDELEKAIHVVYGGGAMINPEIASKVVELFSEMAQQNYDVMIEAENVEKINDMECPVSIIAAKDGNAHTLSSWPYPAIILRSSPQSLAGPAGTTSISAERKSSSSI